MGSNASSANPGGSSANRDAVLMADPLYRGKINERDASRLRINGLQREAATARSQIATYQRRVDSAPMVEQELVRRAVAPAQATVEALDSAPAALRAQATAFKGGNGGGVERLAAQPLDACHRPGHPPQRRDRGAAHPGDGGCGDQDDLVGRVALGHRDRREPAASGGRTVGVILVGLALDAVAHAAAAERAQPDPRLLLGPRRRVDDHHRQPQLPGPRLAAAQSKEWSA